ncbi:MAG: cupredoxin domain-containing protein [Anaerolineales bacterium]
MKTRRYLRVSLVALAFVLVSCSATTTSISTQTPIPPNPSNTPLPNVTVTPTPAPPSGTTDTLPPAATNIPVPAGAGTVDIKIAGFAFDPANVTVKVGTTVRWTNQDSAVHSVTSDAGVWDSGSIAQGEMYTRVFDTVGTFAYHCGVHPSMKGTIIVTS